MTITAPVGLDAAQRSMLERLVIRARALLESDLAAQAEGRFGIHLDGTIEDAAALPDDTTDMMKRRDLEEMVAHLRTLGEDAPGAVARLLREAAFTHLNRLVAIRIAEAIGLLPESLADGPRSRGFKDLGEIMPVLADDYRRYVHLCGDELAADAPALFDPRNPLLALEPSTAAFDELVALMADPGTSEIWLAPDTLGWAYQFFNTGDERREMREASAPRNSRELAVRNQFFTPRYVVDFLVQNTIGRRLIEDDAMSALLDELPLLVNPPRERGPALDLDEVKCLDPACGSGHFLLGCYDVLERAWDLAGITPAASAPKIVASLWGVDIDARCAQVASAAIVLRARRHCRDLELPRPNIVTARGLPGGSAALPPDLPLTARQRTLVDRVSEVLATAPLLGVLLKAEEALDEEIRHGAFGGKPGTLQLTDEAAEATERDLLSHLQTIADQASSSVVERLLAAEADDALRLVDVVRQRYDAVLMNPPFGEPVPETKPYLRSAYAYLPSNCDLFAAFVGRGLELCKSGGYVGAITSRVGLFLSSFEKWRKAVLLENDLVALADLGFGVMEQALVEAAAYVVGARSASATSSASFIRLLRDKDRPEALRSAANALRRGESNSRLFVMAPTDFQSLPRSPIAYWSGPVIRRLFEALPSIEGSAADVRAGLCTGDDFRFIRCSWEVAAHRAMGRGAPQGRWAPFAKGGEYSPFWSDIHLVVDWGRAGANIGDAQLPGTRVQNSQHYFRPGVTWPLRTASGFGPRLLPPDTIFGHKGPSALVQPEEGFVLLGWLTTRLATALLDVLIAAGDETTSGTASKSYEVGLVQRLPWPGDSLPSAIAESLSGLVMQCVALRAREDESDETARRFVAPAILGFPGSFTDRLEASVSQRYRSCIELIELSEAVERLFHDSLELVAPDLAYLNDEIGPHPASYPQAPLDDEAVFAQLFELPMDQLIDEVLATRGGSRSVATMTFVAERRLEVLAHAFRRHPAALAEARERLGLQPPGEARRTASDLVSYIFGIAFGRWDARVGSDPQLALRTPEVFEAVPICAPAMLVGRDGLPVVRAPEGYPLALPAQRLFVDETGHEWDVEAAVMRSAETVFEDPTTMIAETLQILRRKTVRDFLRKQFFKDHLSRYSKSRRKAPIYWPLTVPSKNWGVWVYAPTLMRETLYAVASEAGRRERLAGEAIARLQREQHEGGAGRSARQVAEELDTEEKLAEELRRFRAEAERIAGLGWEPDLDDGIVLCAAPLADLFPSWPETKTARAELRKGKYEWATVAAWADQL